MYFKIKETQNFTLLACTDKQYLGKVFEEGKIYFKIKESFYKDKEVGEEKLKELLKKADNINLFGEKTVKIAIKEGLAEENQIKKIKGIPHLQIIKI